MPAAHKRQKTQQKKRDGPHGREGALAWPAVLQLPFNILVPGDESHLSLECRDFDAGLLQVYPIFLRATVHGRSTDAESCAAAPPEVD